MAVKMRGISVQLNPLLTELIGMAKHIEVSDSEVEKFKNRITEAFADFEQAIADKE